MKFGVFGLVAAGLGIASVFVPGGPVGIFVAFIAIIAGLIGSRRKERLSLAGTGLAGIVLIFLNLQAMGIIPTPVKNGDLMRDYSLAIRSSAKIFRAIKKEATAVPEKRKAARKEVLPAIEETLASARKLDATRFDPFIPGFSEHFQNEFIRGLKFLHSGYTHADKDLKVVGARLLDKWGQWSHDHRKELVSLWHRWRPRPSLFRTIVKD